MPARRILQKKFFVPPSLNEKLEQLRELQRRRRRIIPKELPDVTETGGWSLSDWWNNRGSTKQDVKPVTPAEFINGYLNDEDLVNDLKTAISEVRGTKTTKTSPSSSTPSTRPKKKKIYSINKDTPSSWVY